MVRKDQVLPELYEQDETAWLDQQLASDHRSAAPSTPGLLESGTLRSHAVESLAKAYANGLRQARFDTGAAATAFPAESPYSLDALLADDWSGE